MKYLKSLLIPAAVMIPVLAYSAPAEDPLKSTPLWQNLLSMERPLQCSVDGPLVYSPSSLNMCSENQIQRQEEEVPLPLIYDEKENDIVREEN